MCVTVASLTARARPTTVLQNCPSVHTALASSPRKWRFSTPDQREEEHSGEPEQRREDVV